MVERSYRRLFWVLALVGLTADLASKYVMFAVLYPDADRLALADHLPELRPDLSPDQIDDQRAALLTCRYELIPGVFRLHTHFTGAVETATTGLARLRTLGGERLPGVNHGALFGLGGDFQHHANMTFAVISLLAAGTIIVWSTRPSLAHDWTLCTALGLILAGTLGNFIDRVVFGGVRDFLYFYWIDWPVFNIADCCLVTGASLLLLQALWSPTTAPAPTESAAVASPESV
jgi:signal peptidase II